MKRPTTTDNTYITKDTNFAAVLLSKGYQLKSGRMNTSREVEFEFLDNTNDASEELHRYMNMASLVVPQTYMSNRKSLQAMVEDILAKTR